MNPLRFQFRLRVCMVVIAAIAFNLWLFRFGWLIGLVGLNLSTYMIAILSQVLAVNCDLGSRAENAPATPESNETR